MMSASSLSYNIIIYYNIPACSTIQLKQLIIQLFQLLHNCFSCVVYLHTGRCILVLVTIIDVVLKSYKPL